MLKLQLGGLCLGIESPRPLRWDRNTERFHAPEDAIPNMVAEISWDWPAPDLGSPVGQDLIQDYYCPNGTLYCCLTAGPQPPISCAAVPPDLKRLTVHINTADYAVPQDALSQILRMLPLRMALLNANTWFLHAALIECKGRGILFTAPSGTGKTTQSKLWEQYRGARRLCNDRVLVCADTLSASGYPNDGSDPVFSGGSCPLGCIVLLRQSKINTLTRLTPARAVARLMEQTVLDTWHAPSRAAALDMILGLVERVPVYLLACDISENAVAILEQELETKGVLPRG